MLPFRLSNKARNDLINIAKYTQEQWGIEQRNIYLKQFDDTFHAITSSLSIGHACDYIKMGDRKFPQASHVIFYKPGSTSKIEIIRILHKQMDVNLKLE